MKSFEDLKYRDLGIVEVELNERKPGRLPAFSEYFTTLLNTLYINYGMKAESLHSKEDFNEAMFYRGKCDAMKEALQHYQELHKEYR